MNSVYGKYLLDIAAEDMHVDQGPTLREDRGHGLRGPTRFRVVWPTGDDGDAAVADAVGPDVDTGGDSPDVAAA